MAVNYAIIDKFIVKIKIKINFQIAKLYVLKWELNIKYQKVESSCSSKMHAYTYTRELQNICIIKCNIIRAVIAFDYTTRLAYSVLSKPIYKRVQSVFNI